MLIPRFKLNYLPEEEHQMKKRVLVQAVSALDQQAEATTSEPAAIPQPTSNHDDRDLFRILSNRMPELKPLPN